MSTRTALTVLPQGAYPEVGPSTKTLESLDVTNGNKIAIEGDVVIALYNSAGADKTITFTYDGDDGQVQTKVLTLTTLQFVTIQLEARLGRHASDLAETGYAWLTANGSAGDVKGRATRLKRPLG